MEDWPGTDQIGILVTVTSLVLAVIYAGGPYDVVDAAVGLIGLWFGILYRRRLQIRASTASSFVMSQYFFAWFLVAFVVVVGMFSLLFGVVSAFAPDDGPLFKANATTWLDRSVLGAAFVVGVGVALWKTHRARPDLASDSPHQLGDG